MPESKREQVLEQIKKAVLPKTIGMRGYDTKILYKELKKRYPNTRFFFASDAAMGDDFGYNYILATNEKTGSAEDVKQAVSLYGVYDQTDIYNPENFYDDNKGASDIHGFINVGDSEMRGTFTDDVDDEFLQEPTLDTWLDGYAEAVEEGDMDSIKLPKIWVQKLIKAKYLTKADINKYHIELVDHI